MATTLTFGKHRGETLEMLMATDRSYVDWLARECNNPVIRRAANMLLSAWHETVERINGCPICGNSSCDGEHGPARPIQHRPVSAPPAPAPIIDWRYFRYNLDTDAGRAAFQAWCRDEDGRRSCGGRFACVQDRIAWAVRACVIHETQRAAALRLAQEVLQ